MTEVTTSSSRSVQLCPTCGSRVDEGASRCGVCGTLLRSEARRAVAGKSSQVTLTLPVALAIVAGFALLSAGLTFVAVRLTGVGRDRTPTASPSPTQTTTSTPAPTWTETPVPTFTPLPTLEYKVVANDTCAGLAFRYSVSVRSIIEINNLTPECLLSVGQTLYLPQPTPTASPPPTSTLSPQEATEAACEKVTYTVQANDTLSAIAANYAVDMQAVISYNGMSGPNIFSGQVLIIPLCARQPTAGPSPTATLPPPYPAPNLLLPQDGAAFTLASDTISLQWASVGVLRENEVYKVSVEDVTEGSGNRLVVEYVSDTKFIVSAAIRPGEAVPHVIRWWVQVVRKTGTSSTGQPQYETAGVSSLRRVFTWSGAAPPSTPTP